mgnify:CR=1 FL=1
MGHPTHHDASNVIVIDVKAAKESLPSFVLRVTQDKATKSRGLFTQVTVLTLISASRHSVRNDSRASASCDTLRVSCAVRYSQS